LGFGLEARLKALQVDDASGVRPVADLLGPVVRFDSEGHQAIFD
jgi:hypothetical protein